MSNIESGGKYSHVHPTLGIKLDCGKFYDSKVSLGAYSQWHVGDRIALTLPNKVINFNGWLELFEIALLLISIIGTFVILYFVIFEFFIKDDEK